MGKASSGQGGPPILRRPDGPPARLGPIMRPVIDLEQAPKAAFVGGVALALVLIGLVDYATGTELRVFPLYFLPVLAAALRLGQTAGLAVAVTSALVWLGSNHLAGIHYRNAGVTVANVVVMAVAFSAVALLGALQRRGLERERTNSRTDSLTGLLNGRGFYEGATTELVRARRYGYPVTPAFVDLDGFTQVNARHGHARGDAVLVRVAEVIRSLTRRSDVVGRLGGDEFVVLLPQSGRDAAEPALRKVLAALGRISADGEAPVTASIGAICYEDPPEDLSVLMHDADKVMYAAKAAGKNVLQLEVGPQGG